MRERWSLGVFVLNALAVVVMWLLLFRVAPALGPWGLLILVPAVLLLAWRLVSEMGRRR